MDLERSLQQDPEVAAGRFGAITVTAITADFYKQCIQGNPEESDQYCLNDREIHPPIKCERQVASVMPSGMVNLPLQRSTS